MTRAERCYFSILSSVFVCSPVSFLSVVFCRSVFPSCSFAFMVSFMLCLLSFGLCFLLMLSILLVFDVLSCSLFFELLVFSPLSSFFFFFSHVFRLSFFPCVFLCTVPFPVPASLFPFLFSLPLRPVCPVCLVSLLFSFCL